MSELSQRIAQFNVDAQKVHDVVHGPSTGPGSDVVTEGGSIPTLAKALDFATTEAEGYRDESLSYRDQARLAAESAGATHYAATYAEMDAAKATYPASAVVMVFSDETHGGQAYLYRKEGSAMTAKMAYDYLRPDSVIDGGSY